MSRARRQRGFRGQPVPSNEAGGAARYEVDGSEGLKHEMDANPQGTNGGYAAGGTKYYDPAKHGYGANGYESTEDAKVAEQLPSELPTTDEEPVRHELA
jgi:hypothetical protein